MNKISLIIEREYFSRVKKKSFLIMTIVGPLLFAAISVVPAWLAMRNKSVNVVTVLDQSGLFVGKLKSNKETIFKFEGKDEEAEKTKIKSADDHQLLLVIGPTNGQESPDVRIFGSGNPSLDLLESIENQIKSELKNVQLKQSGIDPGLVEKIDPKVDVKSTVLSEEGEKEGSSAAATIVGFGAGFLIYIFIFLYGSQVMTGVMEEKTNRVVEVIISSVKPFQLMLGKIVGVALVGLTQFLLWAALTYAITTVAGMMMMKSQDSQKVSEEISSTIGNAKQKEMVKKTEKLGLLKGISHVNIPYIFFCFLFYFLGGYLLYSALFAAVGAAVDNQQDAQQFMFPITIPIILAIIMGQFIIKDPNSNLAFWFSVIPFTSPIIMMIRIPFEPPVWQIAVSMVCLVLGFLGTTWLAGKIYRVGILMYGKKTSYKELWKWMRY
jgi:ABC-2 type transport system permease protein